MGVHDWCVGSHDGIWGHQSPPPKNWIRTNLMKTPSLYHKSAVTTRLINRSPEEATTLTVPRLNPHVRVGLCRMATGEDLMLSITGGAALNADLDSLDAQGIPYPEMRIRL